MVFAKIHFFRLLNIDFSEEEKDRHTPRRCILYQAVTTGARAYREPEKHMSLIVFVMKLIIIRYAAFSS